MVVKRERGVLEDGRVKAVAVGRRRDRRATLMVQGWF